MRTIMAAKSPHDSSFSFSRRYFHWKKKDEVDDDDTEEILNCSSSIQLNEEDLTDLQVDEHGPDHLDHIPVPYHSKKKSSIMSVSRLRSALTFGGGSSKSRSLGGGLGLARTKTTTKKLVGTLFGYRHGHIHIVFQDDPKSTPAFLVELATPTSFLVREMASGLVRIALECDKNMVDPAEEKKKKKEKIVLAKLLEEPLWRTYCNGKKCGFTMRRGCGPDEWKVLDSVGPITMGAGVLPAAGVSPEGELMYMRAKFERIIDSKDSEAFYMMNPDGHGGPQLSIYLLRV